MKWNENNICQLNFQTLVKTTNDDSSLATSMHDLHTVSIIILLSI
jgi:hypothetical protein